MLENIKNHEKLNAITQEIASYAGNCKIILYSYKLSPSGTISSFKLCVISDAENKSDLEKKIYLTIDSPFPYDLLVYTTQEWNTLKSLENSFAAKIDRTGCVLYEKEI